MSTKEKLRMCPFCEGSIDIHAKTCRFCGSSLAISQTGARSSAYDTEESLASLYTPPYAPKGRQRRSEEAAVTPREEKKRYAYEEYEEEESVEKKEHEETEKVDQERSHIGSLLLLSIGAQLFTLAALLLFFSDHGRLTLEWKSRYWFLYMVISLPFLYHGWKKLRQNSG